MQCLDITSWIRHAVSWRRQDTHFLKSGYDMQHRDGTSRTGHVVSAKYAPHEVPRERPVFPARFIFFAVGAALSSVLAVIFSAWCCVMVGFFDGVWFLTADFEYVLASLRVAAFAHDVSMRPENSLGCFRWAQLYRSSFYVRTSRTHNRLPLVFRRCV